MLERANNLRIAAGRVLACAFRGSRADSGAEDAHLHEVGVRDALAPGRGRRLHFCAQQQRLLATRKFARFSISRLLVLVKTNRDSRLFFGSCRRCSVPLAVCCCSSPCCCSPLAARCCWPLAAGPLLAHSAAKNKSSSKASAWLVTSALAGAHCGGILVVKLHP